MPIRFLYGIRIVDLTAAREAKNESAYWKGAPTLWTVGLFDLDASLRVVADD